MRVDGGTTVVTRRPAIAARAAAASGTATRWTDSADLPFTATLFTFVVDLFQDADGPHSPAFLLAAAFPGKLDARNADLFAKCLPTVLLHLYRCGRGAADFAWAAALFLATAPFAEDVQGDRLQFVGNVQVVGRRGGGAECKLLVVDAGAVLIGRGDPHNGAAGAESHGVPDYTSNEGTERDGHFLSALL